MWKAKTSWVGYKRCLKTNRLWSPLEEKQDFEISSFVIYAIDLCHGVEKMKAYTFMCI